MGKWCRDDIFSALRTMGNMFLLGNIMPMLGTDNCKTQVSGEKGNLCTVGGNVNWGSHYEEQYGDSLKN